MKKLVMIVLVALAVTVSGSAAAQAAASKSAGAGLTDLLVQFTFKARGEYAHMYIADKLGYYREQGLRVSFQEGTGGGPVLSSLAAKPGNTIVVSAMVLALIAINSGLPLQAVATWQPLSQSVLVARPGIQLNSPKDLIGKTVGAKQGLSVAAMFSNFLKTHGIDANKVTVKMLNPASANAVFIKGDVDVVDAYATNEVPVLEAELGKRLNVLWISKFGYPDLGLGVIVRKDFQETKAGEAIIRGFLTASSRGVDAMKKNPQAAAEAIKEKFGALLPGTPVILEQVKATIASMPQPRGHQYGWLEQSAYEESIATNRKTGVLVDPPGRAPLPVSHFYTNKFLK